MATHAHTHSHPHPHSHEAAREARAVARVMRVSPQKLNQVAGLIRGQAVDRALASLTFSARRIAGPVKLLLQSAIANAENNAEMDVDLLYVKEAWVGRSFVMKRFRARARGRGAKIAKPVSNMTIVLSEREGAI